MHIVNIINNHLREDVTPGTLNFAHKMVTAGKSQSSTDVPHFAQDTPMPSKEPANPGIPTHTSSNTQPPPPPPAAGAVATSTTRRIARERSKSRDDDVMPQAPIGRGKGKPRLATLPPKRIKVPVEGMDGPATAPVPAPVPASVTTKGRPKARVKREVKQEGFAPPPPPPAAPAVTTETTGKPRRERSKSKDDIVRPPGKKAQIKKEIKEEILPTPPPPPPPPVRTETTGKPRARSTPAKPATPAKRVKKEDVKKEVKEEPQSPRPAEARYIKPTGKATAKAKSKAIPIKKETTHIKQEDKVKKGTASQASPYLSQRSDAWWNKQTKADIIKEVEKLGGFVATTAQTEGFSKTDWIKMAKGVGKPDDVNNTGQWLKVKMEEGARRSKTKSRKALPVT